MGREREGNREKRQRNRGITKSQDSMVPWNVNGTLGGEIMTNSEHFIPQTFVSFSQCIVRDIIQIPLFKVRGWATAQLAFQQLQVAIAIATRGI